MCSPFPELCERSALPDGQGSFDSRRTLCLLQLKAAHRSKTAQNNIIITETMICSHKLSYTITNVAVSFFYIILYTILITVQLLQMNDDLIQTYFHSTASLINPFLSIIIN